MNAVPSLTGLLLNHGGPVMSVLQLVHPSNQETISVLKCMLEKANTGQLTGLAACFRLDNGTEEAVFTGKYNSDPAYALAAAMSISWRLTQMQAERP